MQMIETNKLIQHPRNKEFFDDMVGSKWQDFIESIKRRGIVENVVTTQDLVIVSGHQRVRAAKEIGLPKVPINIKHYDEDENKEDMILEDLISTNIMQRGIGNVDPVKMAKCIIELERIKGIKNGGSTFLGNQHTKKEELGNNFVAPTTQKDLAEQLNMNQRQLQNYKKLLNLIPELQDLVSTGDLSATTGYKIWAKMPQEEQEKFFNDIGRDKIKTLTQKATKEIIDKANQEKEELRNENLNLQQKNNNLKDKLIQEQNKPPVEKIVDNTDYEKVRKIQKELESANSKLDRKNREIAAVRGQLEIYKQDSKEYERYKLEMAQLTREKSDLDRQIKSATMLVGLVKKVETFVKEDLAPIKYSRAILEMKDDKIVMENVKDILCVVGDWLQEMNNIMPNKNNVINVEVM